MLVSFSMDISQNIKILVSSLNVKSCETLHPYLMFVKLGRAKVCVREHVCSPLLATVLFSWHMH